MQDIEVLEHLKERIDLASLERDREFLREVSMIRSKAAAQGALSSSRTMLAIVSLATAECRIRAELFVRALYETWNSFRPSPAALLPAEQLVKEGLTRTIETRQQAVMSATSSFGNPGVPSSLWDNFKAEASRAESRLRLQLTEWKMQQSHPSENGGTSQTTTITLSGDNNTVVAGLMNSSASIQIDRVSKQKLQTALSEVRTAVSETSALSPDDKRETLELVADCERELENPTLNKKRLTAALQGIATTIQTVASLGGAYESLKAAMAMIGLPLP